MLSGSHLVVVKDRREGCRVWRVVRVRLRVLCCTVTNAL